MREFPLLPDVELLTIFGEAPKEGDKTIGHVKFLLQRLTDPQATATYSDLCTALEIRDALNKPVASTAAEPLRARLPEAHWELLCKVLKAPSGGYSLYGHCVIGLIASVLDAKQVKDE